MRFYGKHSGRNNIPKFLARSYMFNKNKKKETKTKEKEKTFLQKKSFKEYDNIDWVFYITFFIIAIIIIATSFD